ncbi:MAG: hypothetical protein AMJ81_10160 [Phycisphaerae bacterium SM23_33]|nr:MAG: hypothetical protein AMJ81_10160 [Phycisphaerae bacterium SM23_33]
MDILPAIDLRGGKVVRLSQGDYGRETVYADDPLLVARQFSAAGARWIHVVDLDAARSGRRGNPEAIAGICREVPAAVELGGGIRDDQAVQAALELGVARVIVGSAAVRDWAWFAALAARGELAGKVALSLDARGGELAVHGWSEPASVTVAELAGRARALPLAAVIYTGIERDGMLAGPDLATTAEVIRLSERPVIAAGGVSSLEDVAACKQIGCAGVIVGRAWYEGRIDLAEACALAGA